MISAINQYFDRTGKGAILIGHSAISADSLHLTANLLRNYQMQESINQAWYSVHSRIVGYIDTLQLFRRLYPHLSSYKLKDLVNYFLGGNISKLFYFLRNVPLKLINAKQ